MDEACKRERLTKLRRHLSTAITYSVVTAAAATTETAASATENPLFTRKYPNFVARLLLLRTFKEIIVHNYSRKRRCELLAQIVFTQIN